MADLNFATSDGVIAHERRNLSHDELRHRALTLIRDTVADVDVSGAIINLSGGIDSSTTAALAVDALGSDGVIGLTLPTHASSDSNMRDAKAVATDLGISHSSIQIQPLIDRFEDEIAPVLSVEGTKYAIGNVAARFRMALAYYWADNTSRLVVGTGNRTERLLGYFTKYGDGGVDLLPLGEFYKTEVRALARTLDIPQQVIEKSPTAGLWWGQTDEGELGAPYGLLDPILKQLVDENQSSSTVAQQLQLDHSTVRRYEVLMSRSAHKCNGPSTLARRRVDLDSTRPPSAAHSSTQRTEEEKCTALQKEVESFIRDSVLTASATGVVVNLRGGLDSSVVATLAVEALGADRVYGLVFPCGTATEPHTVNAVSLADQLGIEFTRVNVAPMATLAEELLPSSLTKEAGERSRRNLVARLRMLCAYYASNTSSRLVLGTTNRSRWLLGSFTKYGDGGADVQPLIGIYRTELKAVAETLDIPEAIIEKALTAGEDVDHTINAEFEIQDDEIDEILWRLVDANYSIGSTADELGIEQDVIREYAETCHSTRHKRRVPPTPAMYGTDNTDRPFYELELDHDGSNLDR